jgi:hypothetical protein
MPPFSDLGFSGPTRDGSVSVGSTEGGFGSAPIPPSTANGGGTTQGAGDPATGTGGSGNGTGTSANKAAGGASSEDSGSCQVAFGHATQGSTALLGLLGFLGLARRRRARAA